MTVALECVGKGQNGFIKILEDAVELPGRDDGDPKGAAETEEMSGWCWGDTYNRGSGLGNSSYIGHWEEKASEMALGVSTFDLGETLTKVPGL